MSNQQESAIGAPRGGKVRFALEQLEVARTEADHRCHRCHIDERHYSWRNREIFFELSDEYDRAQQELTGAISAALYTLSFDSSEVESRKKEWSMLSSSAHPEDVHAPGLDELRSVRHVAMETFILQLLPQLRTADAVEQQQLREAAERRADEKLRNEAKDRSDSRSIYLPFTSSVLAVLVSLAAIVNPTCQRNPDSRPAAVHVEGTFTIDGAMLSETENIRATLGSEVQLKCAPKIDGVETSLGGRTWIVNLLPSVPRGVAVQCEVGAPGIYSSATTIRLPSRGKVVTTGYTIHLFRHKTPPASP